MRKSKIISLLVSTAAASVAVVGLNAGTGLAAAPPVPEVTGGIAMSGPPQYAAFSAFASTPAKGSFTYTNFEQSAAGSGVWALGRHVTLVFDYYGPYAWNVTLDPAHPTSNTSYGFTGTAASTFDPTISEFSGTVSGTTVSFHMLYTNGAYAGYTLDATGTIQPDGSVTGGSSDSLGRALTWTMPAGSAFEVLSYTAAVTTATVDPVAMTASFGFTIPSAAPAGLAGLPITVNVTDGGSPGMGNDTYGHGVTGGAINAYTIIGGNLVVHS